MLPPAAQRGFCGAALLGFVNCLSIVFPPASGTNQSSAVRSASSSFMIVSGISAGEELCLVVVNGLVDYEGTALVLAPCLSALAPGLQIERFMCEFECAVHSPQPLGARSAFLVILYTHIIVWFAHEMAESSSACSRMAIYSVWLGSSARV
jgi:hypothetical protein